MNAERILVLPDEETTPKTAHHPLPGCHAVTTVAPLTDADLLGASDALDRLRAVIRKVARTQATVFIRGECGSGKETAARALHQQSPRAAQPLLKLDCASFPETALDTELFGLDKSSPSKAEAPSKGCFELAQGGTVLLEEVSLLP